MDYRCSQMVMHGQLICKGGEMLYMVYDGLLCCVVTVRDDGGQLEIK